MPISAPAVDPQPPHPAPQHVTKPQTRRRKKTVHKIRALGSSSPTAGLTLTEIAKSIKRKLRVKFMPEDWQCEFIRKIFEGNDGMLCAGTGYGKSLVFEGLAALGGRDRTVVIISPLKALERDQDGVLIRGSNVLPEAKEALRILAGDNCFKKKIPFLLLTNGGGVSEAARARSLSSKLGVEIEEEQYIQAHTLLRTHAHRFAHKPVLVLGGKNDTVRRVAESYGFNQVYNTLDVLAWNPSTWPFHQLTDAEKASTKPADFSKLPVSAVFVFHDPRNWALDVQILCDIVRSGGIVGGPWVPLQQQQTPVEVVFCNPDLLWGSDFPTPRIGQGGFKEAFQAVHKSMTGHEYPHIQYGKPTKATYDYAKEVLHRRFNQEYGTGSTPRNLYMIGDNPESGANAAQWNSILVRTGVYDPKQGPPRHKPTHTTGDVLEAVQWAVQRESTAHSVTP